MSKVQKAGVIVLSQTVPHKIALIYQDSHSDFTFPKGHLEKGETLLECAIRETKEETGLDVQILKALKPIFYRNDKDGDVEVHYFLGESLDDSRVCPEKGIKVVWTPIDAVVQKLSYQNLKTFFADVLKNEKL